MNLLFAAVQVADGAVGKDIREETYTRRVILRTMSRHQFPVVLALASPELAEARNPLTR